MLRREAAEIGAWPQEFASDLFQTDITPIQGAVSRMIAEWMLWDCRCQPLQVAHFSSLMGHTPLKELRPVGAQLDMPFETWIEKLSLLPATDKARFDSISLLWMGASLTTTQKLAVVERVLFPARFFSF